MMRLRDFVCFGCCFAHLLLLPPPAGPQRHVLPAPRFARNQQAASGEALAAQSPMPALRDYYHWPRLPVRVFIATESGPERQWARTAQAGFDEWVGATDGVVGYRLVRLPGQAQVRVRFAPGATVPEHPDLVGVTTTYWTGPVLESAEIVLATDRRTSAELQTVAAHEFGHALGIRGHSGNPEDLMFPSLIRCLPPKGAAPSCLGYSVTKHDLDNLKRCYPALLVGQADRPEEQAARAGSTRPGGDDP